MSVPLAVFFDIGDTLARPVVTGGGRLVGLRPYPLVTDVLQQMEDADLSLGLISNTGTETAQSLRDLLEDAELLPFFRGHMLLFSSVEGLDKSDPAFFELARDRAGVPAARCLFVGESEAERAVAKGVGFQVSPHPLHALDLVREDP